MFRNIIKTTVGPRKPRSLPDSTAGNDGKERQRKGFIVLYLFFADH